MGSMATTMKPKPHPARRSRRIVDDRVDLERRGDRRHRRGAGEHRELG
jgi:hypothetical protein